MKKLYIASEHRTTLGQTNRVASDAKRGDRPEAQRGIAANAQKYDIEVPGASLGIVRRVLPDVTTMAREFCEAHHIGFEIVFPNLSLDVIAHVQTYGLSGRDQLLGITTRLIRAYLPPSKGCD